MKNTGELMKCSWDWSHNYDINKSSKDRMENYEDIQRFVLSIFLSHNNLSSSALSDIV